MTLRTMKDSAWPTSAGPLTDIVLIYVGGDTPHPWTTADILSMPERYRFPTWVRSNPSGFNGAIEGALFVAWLHGHGVPMGACVCLDLETAINAAYVNSFNLVLRAAGYRLTKYGSTSTIWQNPKTDGGTYVAEPGATGMDTTGDTIATQFAYDGVYDLSWVMAQPIAPLWDTKPVIVPPVSPPTPTPMFKGKETKMFIGTVNQSEIPVGTQWPGVFIVSEGSENIVLTHIESPADHTELLKVMPACTISYTQYIAFGGTPAIPNP
jgi:hypothetical protein